jgi:hypothetical protein
VQTWGVRRPFSGPPAASFSDFGPIQFRQLRVIQRLMRHAGSTV